MTTEDSDAGKDRMWLTLWKRPATRWSDDKRDWYGCIRDHAFAAAGPQLWNNLPVDNHQPDLTLGQFYRLL